VTEATAHSRPNLGPNEVSVLRVLLDANGKVVSRQEIARRANLRDLGDRRTDSLIVAVRRALGAEAIRTVRGRGWMLVDSARDRARELLAKGQQPD